MTWWTHFRQIHQIVQKKNLKGKKELDCQIVAVKYLIISRFQLRRVIISSTLDKGR